jgi:hypothetical protein
VSQQLFQQINRAIEALAARVSELERRDAERSQGKTLTLGKPPKQAAADGNH